MSCESCGSERQVQFDAEINIHFSGVRNIDEPGVLVFPKVVICIDCGASQFSLPTGDLGQLRQRLAA